MSKHRPLYEIANEIRENWANVSIYAAPYIDAFGTADQITEIYIIGDHHSSILGFMCNCGGWRGEVARKVKKELRSILDNYNK